eukprot:m.64670 g.64670  ORF g.64670 m.64670 type:complete len:216 (+) comp19569_c0_seq2:242-889(+)
MAGKRHLTVSVLVASKTLLPHASIFSGNQALQPILLMYALPLARSVLTMKCPMLCAEKKLNSLAPCPFCQVTPHVLCVYPELIVNGSQYPTARSNRSPHFQESFFLKGVDCSKTSGYGHGHLLHHLFGVRALGLSDIVPAKAQRDYLSGLVIGHEVRAALQDCEGTADTKTVFLLGSSALMDRYERVLKHLGRKGEILSPDAAFVGLFSLANKGK